MRVLSAIHVFFIVVDDRRQLIGILLFRGFGKGHLFNDLGLVIIVITTTVNSSFPPAISHHIHGQVLGLDNHTLIEFLAKGLLLD